MPRAKKSRSERNAYMRQYMSDRYRRRKAEALERLGGCCALCGNFDDLEFDHIDPKTKRYTIARIWLHSESKFWAEIVKCQLLCRMCHEEKTIIDLNKKRAKGAHGTLSTYRYCKCSECRMAKADYSRDYNQRKFGSVA